MVTDAHQNRANGLFTWGKPLLAAFSLLVIIPLFVSAVCDDYPLPNHCCPVGYEFDLTHRCCMPEDEAVRLVEMQDRRAMEPTDASMGMGGDDCCVEVGYCEEKIRETGNLCGHAEGPCRNETRDDQPVNECENGLACAQSYFSTSKWETACCKEGTEIWTGKECMAYNNSAPWYASWTRSGDVKLHSLGGQMIPNGPEAAAFNNPQIPYNIWPYDQRNMGQGDEIRWCDNNNCGACRLSILYKPPPSPIWFEARNLGDNYQPAYWVQACNGPFDGRDTTIRPFKNDFGGLSECAEKNCNCGRAMDGLKDRADGIKIDGAGCNVMDQTSCVRGEYPAPFSIGDPETDHKCNCVGTGHGGFNGDGDSCGGWASANPPNYYAITNSTPVDPNFDYVEADEFVPELCGRIQRKEVENVGGYYPRYYEDSPRSWFDYIVYEYDENHQIIQTTPHEKVGDDRNNDITSMPPRPYTLLKENTLDFAIGGGTRYIKVEMNYTVENQIIRTMYLKQCTWRGCSRLEEEVYHYQRTREQLHCGVWTTETTDHDAGSPPNCCLRTDWRPILQGCGPMGTGKRYLYQCGGCTYDDCIDAETGLPGQDGIPDTNGYDQYYDDCDCMYSCWGCWHFEGQTDWYPLTKPNADSGDEEKAYEQINDTSVVKAKEFGNHLRVENPLTRGNAETRTTVRGRMLYGDPEAYDYAMGYITVKMADEESIRRASGNPSIPLIDMFSGLTFMIPNVSIMDVRTKQYPTLHTLYSLESTLPLDYILLQRENTYQMRMHRMCYYNENGILSIPDLDKFYSQQPIYIRWLQNPAKKYVSYMDLYQASGTRYNLWAPIVQADLANQICRNYFDERSESIPLLRNFAENEPLYYDFESLHIKPENIEANIKYYGYDPATLGNAQMTELSKPFQNVYVRQAPACNEGLLAAQDINDCGNCPDMCSAIANTVCNGGMCDCEYMQGYADLFPKDVAMCNKSNIWKLTEQISCEGPPSKYKSFCSRGRYYALWLDTFQVMFKADDAVCMYQPVKVCNPKEIEPNSFTLIFEPSATINEWNTTNLTLYSHFQQVSFNPFGNQSPCVSQISNPSAGGLSVFIEKPKPKLYTLEYMGSTNNGETIQAKIRESDLCDTTRPETTDCQIKVVAGKTTEGVYVEFEQPYASYTGWYSAGQILNIQVIAGNGIKASLRCLKDSGFYQSRQGIGFIAPQFGEDSCDWLLDNMWILIIAYLMVMSFQLFERLDPHEFWKKFQGKE
ncbi:MAG: hypothetical protein V1875_00555 [Candidatus Altiarchaeota archaeon]